MEILCATHVTSLPLLSSANKETIDIDLSFDIIR